MTDGRTHLAHKAEHAVDLDTGAVVAATLQGADQSDTKTLDKTLSEAGMAVAELIEHEVEQRPEQKPKVNEHGVEELIADRGYHSGAVLERMNRYEVRTYIPEKKQKGRRRWQEKGERQKVVHQNRERVRGEYGKRLLRRRGEFVERRFAHCYETGGMRRCHLRGHKNILKRQLIHVGAFNLSLILRKLLGARARRGSGRTAVAYSFCLLIGCSHADKVCMGSSEANRQYLEQNTLGDHEVEYSAGRVANQILPPRTAKADDDAQKAYEALRGKSDKFLVYRRAQVPPYLHFDSNPREGDPVVIPTGPYLITANTDARGLGVCPSIQP